MSEETFRDIHPNGELQKINTTITGASNHSLEVLGKPRTPLHLTFYNPDDRKQDSIQYTMTPIIVRNLAFPLLLSHSDLTKLKAVIDVANKELTINGPQGPAKYPLVGAPRQKEDARTCGAVTIKPGHQGHVMVNIKNSKEGDVLYVEPEGEFVVRQGLQATAMLVTVDKNHQVPVRVKNSSPSNIKVRNNLKIGWARPYEDVLESVLDHWEQVFATTRNSHLQEAKPLTKDALPEVKTRGQLKARLRDDLGFNDPGHSLTEEQKEEIVQILANHRPALSLDYSDLGHVRGVQFHIPTGDAKPVKSKCRTLPPHLRQLLKEQIERWLTQKVITKCDGPWAAPIVPVPKKNGGWRFAVDYRGLNAVTTKDARPVANMEDQLAKVRSNPAKKLKFFASLDLSEAYNSVDVAEEDKPKTAMISPFGLHQFNKMSFGLAGAPQAFHTIVQMIEEGMHKRDPEMAKTILLYFDDCLLAAETFEELATKL